MDTHTLSPDAAQAKAACIRQIGAETFNTMLRGYVGIIGRSTMMDPNDKTSKAACEGIEYVFGLMVHDAGTIDNAKAMKVLCEIGDAKFGGGCTEYRLDME